MRRLYRLQQLILAFGDLALIMLASMLSPFIRMGYMVDVFRVHTGATFITLFFYLIFFYIFSLYDLNRNNSFGDMALRCMVAVTCATGPIAFLFYTLPSWRYGRGIWFIQMVLVWCFATLWRRIYAIEGMHLSCTRGCNSNKREMMM